jgi:hypothetical protein
MGGIVMRITSVLIVFMFFFGYSIAIGEDKPSNSSDKAREAYPSAILPKPQVEIKSEQIALVNEKILDIALKRLDNTISLFATLMSIIVAGLGLGIAFMQYTQNKNLKDYLNRKLSDWEKAIDLEKRMETWKDKMDGEIKNDVEEKVQRLFDTRYRDLIFNYTKSFTSEILLLTPDARGLLMSRLRNMDRELEKVISEKWGKEISNKFHDILGRTIEDWHTLGQLFSSDSIQLQAGLLSIRANPFPEIGKRLSVLQARYQEDGELYPMIIDAISQVEKMRN